jgi:hypothetical protein
MVNYGAKDFKVFFDDIEVGDHVDFSAEPMKSVSNKETSSGVRNIKNDENKGQTLSFNGLDFANDEETYMKVREMVIVNGYIENIVVQSTRRWQNGQEFIESFLFKSNSVIPTRNWSVTDDWTRALSVSSDTEILLDPVLI